MRIKFVEHPIQFNQNRIMDKSVFLCPIMTDQMKPRNISIWNYLRSVLCVQSKFGVRVFQKKMDAIALVEDTYEHASFVRMNPRT